MYKNFIDKRTTSLLAKYVKKLIPDKLNRLLLIELHRGKKFTCPFCNYSSRDLSLIGIDLPVYADKRVKSAGLREGGCFKCGSLDRERLIYFYLRDFYKLFERDKDINILHIAPEKKLSETILSNGYNNYICGDLFTDGYNYPPHVLNMNVLDLPYPENYFDLIMCNHVLEHIPTDLDAMKELNRVLKKEGTAVLQVPISDISETTIEDNCIISPLEREVLYGQKDHVRLYGQDYFYRLELCGFVVERVNITNQYLLYGVVENEEICVCTRH